MSEVICDGRAVVVLLKVCKMVETPALLCGLETAPMTRRKQAELEVSEMKKDRIENKHVRKTAWSYKETYFVFWRQKPIDLDGSNI